MEIRLLGSGGWMPTDRRETACVYLRRDEHVLLLDAGTGMRRLVTEPELLDGVEQLSIALTHFHLDHTAGLVSLPALSHVPVREVWAPGQIVADEDADDLVHRLLAPPFLTSRAEDVRGELLTEIHELDDGAEIGPFSIETRVQTLHACPTLALKVDGDLVYCTDTAFDVGNVAFALGARLLLHEAFHTADETDDHMHSAAGEAARIAAAAEVDRLLLVHLNPTIDSNEHELTRFARARFLHSDVASDGPIAAAVAR